MDIFFRGSELAWLTECSGDFLIVCVCADNAKAEALLNTYA